MDIVERIQKFGPKKVAEEMGTKMYEINVGDPHKAGKGYKLMGRKLPLIGLLIKAKTFHRGCSSLYLLEDGMLLETASHYGSAAQKAWSDFSLGSIGVKDL